MTGMEKSMDKIASALDRISRQGIAVNIRFPAETDKFALDLASMKISEGLESIADALRTEVLTNDAEQIDD